MLANSTSSHLCYNLIRMNTLKDKKVLVLGLARSGMAAIRVLHRYQAVITLSERKKKEELKERNELEEMGVEIISQEEENFDRDFDLVVKNPGVPPVSPIVRKLKDRGIPVITEIELAVMLMKPQHIAAITGTNGKTTCTTLLYEILRAKYKEKALVGGNIGTPLCELAEDHDLFHNEGSYISLEISNHQLIDTISFHPEVSVIINLSPDHIETMGSLENYYYSKTLVYKNMNEDDLFLLNIDDPLIEEYMKKYPCPASIRTFSVEKDADACIRNGSLYLNGKELMPVKEVKIVGKHNLQNILVCALMADRFGVESTLIREVVRNFTGVEHRIEFVREVNGVRYYNDSKATNTDATITALKAFDRNVILLVGGYEKGLSMEEVKKYLSPVKMIIGFGIAGKRIAGDLSEDAVIVSDLKEALQLAHDHAEAGDVVLLSPSTSSYDQYSGYEERGRHFKTLVNEL